MRHQAEEEYILRIRRNMDQGEGGWRSGRKPEEKRKMISYLKKCENPIVLVDNHLSKN